MHSDLNKHAPVFVLSFPIWDLWCTLGLHWGWRGSIYCLWIAVDCAGVLNIVSTAPAHWPLRCSPLQPACSCAICGGNFQAAPVCLFFSSPPGSISQKKSCDACKFSEYEREVLKTKKKERSKSRNQAACASGCEGEAERKRKQRGRSIVECFFFSLSTIMMKYGVSRSGA